MWQPGQSGNPSGTPRPKRFMNMLERVMKQDDEKRLRAAVEKLMDLAAEGEPWAVQMIADRLDGKAIQMLAGDPDGAPLQVTLMKFTEGE